MSVLDYLRGFTSQGSTSPSAYPIDTSRYSLVDQYPGTGQFSGFSLTGPAEPPYGQPASPSLLTPEQQAFASSAGPQMTETGMASPQPMNQGAQLASLLGSGYQTGQAIGQAAAGPTVDQQIFTTHFGAQAGQQQPLDINSIPPEMQQLLQALFSAGGFH